MDHDNKSVLVPCGYRNRESQISLHRQLLLACGLEAEGETTMDGNETRNFTQQLRTALQNALSHPSLPMIERTQSYADTPSDRSKSTMPLTSST